MKSYFYPVIIFSQFLASTAFAASTCPSVGVVPECFASGPYTKDKPSSDTFQNEFDEGFDILKSEMAESFISINNTFLKSSKALSDDYKKHISDFNEATAKKFQEMAVERKTVDQERIDKERKEEFDTELNEIAEKSPFDVVVSDSSDENATKSESTEQSIALADNTTPKVKVVDVENMQAQCNIVKGKKAYFASNNQKIKNKSSLFFASSKKMNATEKLTKESILFDNPESPLYRMNLSANAITKNHKDGKTRLSIYPFINNIAPDFSEQNAIQSRNKSLAASTLTYLSRISVSRHYLLDIASKNNSSLDSMSKNELLKSQLLDKPILLNKKAAGLHNVYFSYLTNYNLSLEELAQFEDMELLLATTLSNSVTKK